MTEELWSRVVRELAEQPFPESLRRATVELGVALHRVDVSKRNMQTRVQAMMADPVESELPIAAMRAWPEFAAQEESRVALHLARRSVEAQSRAWVAGLAATPQWVVEPSEPALPGGSDSMTETMLPPESDRRREAIAKNIREELLTVAVGVAYDKPVCGVRVFRVTETAWLVENGGTWEPEANLTRATASILSKQDGES